MLMNKMIVKGLALFSVLVVWCCGTRQDPSNADLIFIHGKIWGGGDSVIFSEAVAIKGNKILKVGTSNEVLETKGERTEVIDLKGRLMIPGFNDAHTHFLSGSIGLS